MSDLLDTLATTLRATWPELIIDVNRPDTGTGPAWLSTQIAQHDVDVAWRPDVGFGVSVSTDGREGMFLGPDRVVTSVDAAYAVIVQALQPEAVLA